MIPELIALAACLLFIGAAFAAGRWL